MEQTPIINRSTVLRGWYWMLFQLLLLPSLLTSANRLLPAPLSALQVNFIFYSLNLTAVIILLRTFWISSFVLLKKQWAAALKTILLGFLMILLATELLTAGIRFLLPDFLNQNDAVIIGTRQESWLLTALGAVILVPPAEETFFRELIFRQLYLRNKQAAYLISALLFSAIHILGYAGKYPPIQLLAGFVQYLPAGFCLAWSYAKTGSLYVPIAIHAAVNARSMLQIL